MRKLLSNPLMIHLLARLYHLYYQLVFHTSRITIEGSENIEEHLGKRPVIVAFWHGRIFYMTYFKRQTEVHAIVSLHRDGELIAKCMNVFGIRQIRGSTNRNSSHPKGAKNRGGSNVLRNCVKVLKLNHVIAITPDGPRGPRMHAEGNILPIAARMEAVIIPLTFSAKWAITARSWDRFMIPLPFSRVILKADTPFTVNAETPEITRKALEDQLNIITAEVDRRLGRTPVEPA